MLCAYCVAGGLVEAQCSQIAETYTWYVSTATIPTPGNHASSDAGSEPGPEGGP
jgi:hypothetical protein